MRVEDGERAGAAAGGAPLSTVGSAPPSIAGAMAGPGSPAPPPLATMTGPSAHETAKQATPWRGPDRRKRPTPRFSRYVLWGGRRKRIRRTSEREGSFVDAYGTRLLLIVMWIALMNVADSFFTLIHLQSGGSEANPIAEMLLEQGRIPFVLLKSGLIAIALLVLCVHKNFHLARIGLWTAALSYTLLLVYHLSLFHV